MTSRPRKILLVAPNWLGDAVMSLPLVGYLAAADVRLVVLATEYTARVYWGLAEAGEIVVASKTGRSRQFVQRARLIRRLGCDGSVVLPPSFSSALHVFLAGVPYRLGFSDDVRRPLLAPALSRTGLRNEHLSANYIRLGRGLTECLGLNEPEDPVRPRVQVFENERNSLDEILNGRKAPLKDYAVVVPGATYGSTKTWPPEKYRELVGHLSKEIPIVLCGGERERQLCDTIAGGLNDVFNLASATSLGEFIALLDRASVVVANDSGAPHVAGSLGVPVVVMFGSTSPTWTAPLGDHVTVVREPVECSPCFLERCPTQLECFDGITTDKVLAATQQALRRGSLIDAGGER